MVTPTQYQTIEREAVAEYKDRGSRFIGYALPIVSSEDFKKRLKQIKDEHPKAAHHCFAYRLGVEGTDFRASDDGEPAGTAGKPILGQLDGKRLTNTGIIVVRYFGGTLLGVPGLINAYKTASSLSLQLTPIIEKPILEVVVLQFDYTMMNELMMIVKRWGCVVQRREESLFCRLEIGVPKAVAKDCIADFTHLHGLSVSELKKG